MRTARAARSLAPIALAIFAIASDRALAVPAAGAALAPVTIERVDGYARTLPDRALPILVLYEDRHAGAQNQHVQWLLDRVSRDINRGKVEVVAVGDVSAYDFWPAKRFVLADIRERQARDKATIWLDWKGAVRKRWSLTSGKSALLLVDAAGRVKFAAEGPLSKAEVSDLSARLADLGCDLN